MYIYKFIISAVIVLTSANYTWGCGYAFINQCSNIIKLNVNGQSTEYQVGACTYLDNFDGLQLGEINSLVLDEIRIITWESCANNVMFDYLQFRIYKEGTVPGAFQSLNINYLYATTTGTYRTKRRKNLQTLDFLEGLNLSGNYILEIYSSAAIDSNNSGIPNAFIYNNNNGLNFKASFSIQSNFSSTLTLSNIYQSNVSCFGQYDGAISVQANGGQIPYSYQWSNGDNSNLNSNLPAGNYTVTVTDGLENTTVESWVVSQPDIMNISTQTTPTTENNQNGSIVANVSGGTPPYAYLWSNGSNQSSISNLAAGTYHLTVSDNNQCLQIQQITIQSQEINHDNHDYCQSSGQTPWFDWINVVDFAGINNTTSKKPYKHYLFSTANVIQGASYPISIQNGFGYYTYNEYFRIWIDYNQNGTFEEPQEIAFSYVLPSPPQGTHSGLAIGSVEIPNSANPGSTRMRVSIKRNTFASPCETIIFGEVEDYNVYINANSNPICQINAIASEITCLDNGTSQNPTDDNFTFNLNVTGLSQSNTWIANINGNTFTGNYGTPTPLGPFAISDGHININVQESQNSNCTNPITVQAPNACSNDDDNTAQPYCEPNSTFPWHDWIMGVQVDNQLQSSTKTPYTHYTNTNINLSLNTAVSLSLTSGFSWFTHTEYWKVWIDYNHDGIFDDNTELAISNIVDAPPNGTLSHTSQSNILIPNFAIPGPTQMRVIMSRYPISSPCQNIAFGEIEDYDVNISLQGYNNSFANITPTTMRLDAQQGIEKYQTILEFYALTQFEIETVTLQKSLDGQYFHDIESYQTDQYTTNEIYFFYADIVQQQGYTYYRVQLNSTNQTIHYTPIQVWYTQKPSQITLFPNPSVKPTISLDFGTNALKGHYTINLFDPFGKLLIQDTHNYTPFQAIKQIDISQLHSGNYYLLISHPNQRPKSIPFIKF